MAICTWGFFRKNGMECLDVATKELLRQSHGRKGKHAIYGSCYIRFGHNIFRYVTFASKIDLLRMSIQSSFHKMEINYYIAF